MSDEQRAIKVQAEQDQVWSALAERTDQITMLASSFPYPPNDAGRLMQAVMCAAAGKLLLERHNRKAADGESNP